jgi:two-component system response regulator MtrA
MAERVLLIEDDQELGAQIVEHLRRAGYEPVWWKDGAHILPDAPPDVALVVLDLMLPGVYGLDVLKQLRSCSEVPVLVLSARNDTSDKVRALKFGADDYMTKPFWPEELIERVRARMRRPVLHREEAIEAGPLRIDLALHEVLLKGHQVRLTPVEFNILVALARRPGAAVTRQWLAESVLDAERDGDGRTLDVHVSRLRKKLGSAKLVETVWGIGYRLVTGEEG